MATDDLRSMLGRIRAVRHACDLDLLLFFYRHPRALLTSEQLVAYLGYDRERVEKSLDGLIEAGHLTRSQSTDTSRAAHLYVLDLRGPDGALLASFLKVAATQQGRRDVIRLLESGPNGAPGGLQLLRRSENGRA